MSHSRLALCLAPLLGLIPASAAPAAQDPLPKPSDILASLEWLEGAWRGQVNMNVFEASYTSPEGGEILSCSKEIANGRCVFYELERFLVEKDEVVLVPHPGGKASIKFPLSDWDPTARKVTFENLTHDFPKTFVYHRAADDRLVITLTGLENGKTRTEVYDLKRKQP